MKNKLLFSTLVIVMLVLSACTGQAASPGTTTGGQPADTSAAPAAVMPAADTATPPAPVLMDPALSTSDASRKAIGNVYEGLVSMTNGQFAVQLASSVTPSEDGLDYLFALRPGVSFHDGSKLDADAVVANFNRWFDPTNPLHGTGAYEIWAVNFGGFKGELTSDNKPKSEVDGIEKVDDMTVLVHLNTPDVNFLNKLADPAFSIASPAALQAAGFGTQSGTDGGTGPYKIGKWDGSNLTLDPYSGYWNPGGVPASSMQVTLGQ